LANLGGANLKGIQIVENYSFGGFKSDRYGRPDAGFEANSTDTIYRGTKGVAAWLKSGKVADAKGFGTMASLAVAQSQPSRIAAVRGAIPCINQGGISQLQPPARVLKAANMNIQFEKAMAA
jgi:hypothetical protein